MQPIRGWWAFIALVDDSDDSDDPANQLALP